MTRVVAGLVVLVEEDVVLVVVGGAPLDTGVERTMRNVAPINSTTMMRTTLSEGW
jgi:hypothetical protein